MTNPFTQDRQTLAAALAAATEYKVLDYPAEVVSARQIIFDTASHQAGEIFGTMKTRYKIYVIMAAADARRALEESEKIGLKIYKAVVENDLADVENIGCLFNFQDASRNIFPAITLSLLSTITL